jgi:ferredoxin
MQDPRSMPAACEAGTVRILWPEGTSSGARVGEDWLVAARRAGVAIPTGCLGGSCGACEIEVNGEVVRACISRVPGDAGAELEVTLACDPAWG